MKRKRKKRRTPAPKEEWWETDFGTAFLVGAGILTFFVIRDMYREGGGIRWRHASEKQKFDQLMQRVWQ